MPVDNNSTAAKPGSRLRELGLVLPKAPTPLQGNRSTLNFELSTLKVCSSWEERLD
jgi:hypothetical protein